MVQQLNGLSPYPARPVAEVHSPQMRDILDQDLHIGHANPSAAHISRHISDR